MKRVHPPAIAYSPLRALLTPLHPVAECLAVALGVLTLFGATRSFASDQVTEAAVFNIKSYGAIGDGSAMETEAVQKTTDTCHAAGGGVVRIPAGDFQIGTIHLKSNLTLSLDHGASLLGSRQLDDYPSEGLTKPREGGPRCLIYAENARISYPGGGTKEHAEREVPEDIARYPEQFFFGPLPAWGAYIRHARNVQFKNVVLETRTQDARKRIVLEDVEGFSEAYR